MSFIIYEGRIDIVEPDGQRTDYESFIVTQNPDGSRTMRTVTRSPRGDLLRDVNQREGRDWQPLEAMGRLYFKNELLGSLMRRIVDGVLHSWLWSPEGQLDYQTFDAPNGMSLGFHPIFHEGWKMNHVSTSHNEPQSILTHTVSNTWNGRSLSHGVRLRSRARFDGVEAVTVPAGTFDCRRYTWFTPFDKELIIWAHGPDSIFVKELVDRGDKAGTLYELSALRKETVNW